MKQKKNNLIYSFEIFQFWKIPFFRLFFHLKGFPFKNFPNLKKKKKPNYKKLTPFPTHGHQLHFHRAILSPGT